MHIDGFLILPAVDKKYCLGIIHREEVSVLLVSSLSSDGTGNSAALHLLGKFSCVSVLSCVVKIQCDTHVILLLFFVSFWLLFLSA